MGRSILNITLTNKTPFVLATIPFGINTKGLPFVYESFASVTNWYLVNNCTGEEYELNISFISTSNNKHYYNADIDLFAYLQGLGDSPEYGVYYYKINFAGTIRYSQLFIFESFDNTTYAGDFNNDFNDDFLI